MLPAWRGVRVVDGAALEKRWALSLVGSNPTLSARHGEVLEWSNRRAWRARVAFGDRGFESHPLRHSNHLLSHGYFIFCLTFLPMLQCFNSDDE
jgi:hypothetical protein